jgi:hypothetical protein
MPPIRCQLIKITVNGERVVISTSGDFREVVVVRESFFVFGSGTSSTADYWLDVANDDYQYEASWSHNLRCSCRASYIVSRMTTASQTKPGQQSC